MTEKLTRITFAGNNNSKVGKNVRGFILISFVLSSVCAVATPSPTMAFNWIQKNYDPAIIVKQARQRKSFAGCDFFSLKIMGKDPVTSQRHWVRVHLYNAKKNMGKAVIILPPTGGVNLLDRGYANKLCFNGITSAIVTNWSYKDDDSTNYDSHNFAAIRALTATRHTVEYLKSLNYHSIGMLGTSIGAITGSLVLGFEPRVDAVVFIAGCAKLPEVIARSEEKGAKALRQKRMKTFGYTTLEQYMQALKDNVWINPSDYLSKSHLPPAFVIIANDDETVPTEYQLEMIDLLNTKKLLKLPGDHLSVIQNAFLFYRRNIIRFFLKEL